MTKNYIQDLAKYINQVDHACIAWLQHINDDQWEKHLESSVSSVKATAIHMASAKKIWIDFWTKKPHPVYMSSVFKGSRSELLAIWAHGSEELIDVIEPLSDEDCEKPVTFIYPNGKKGQMIFWQTFLHFVNHATFHRGQLVTLLRQSGFTHLSNTDLATYFLSQQ